MSLLPRLPTTQPDTDHADAEAVPTAPHVSDASSDLKSRLLLADGLAVVVALLFASAVQLVVRPVHTELALAHVLLGAAALPGFALGAALSRMHLARANEQPAKEARNVVRTVAVGIGVLVAIAFLIQFKELSRLWVVMFAVGSVGALLVERGFARRRFRRLRESGQLTRSIVIVGTDAHAISLRHTYARNPQLGYRVLGFVGDEDIGERAGARVLGPVSELEDVLERTGATGVLICQTAVEHDDVNSITRRLTDEGYHVTLSSMLTDIDIGRLLPQELDGRTMIYVEPVVRDGWRAVAKRAFDIVAAITLLVVTSPLLLVAVIAILVEDGRPIFFRQRRVGLDGELFTMTKLRTMVVDAERRLAELADQNEADGPLFKMERDPRVTRVGRILRKLSIDELPQLYSVLIGDMSMVGPRPALPDEIADWDEALHERLRVMPGLTGLWQVSGRSDSSFEQYRRLDLYYVHNWSLLHDLKICIRTVGVVLTGRGAA